MSRYSDIYDLLQETGGYSESYFSSFTDNANSLERIQQYLVVDQEPKPVPDGVPPASWPTSGDLSVENLSARYSAVSIFTYFVCEASPSAQRPGRAEGAA